MISSRREQYLNLFVTAWEGGSNYWAFVKDLDNAETTFNKIMDDDYTLKVYDRESDEVWTLEKSDIFGSLRKLKKEFPEHYKSVENGTWDAETADIWFQLVVIGEYTFA